MAFANQTMKALVTIAAFMLCASSYATDPQVLFSDDFNGKLGEGWSWVREHPEAWRVRSGALEVKLEPGNMWGSANNARNVQAYSDGRRYEGRPVSIADMS